MEERADASDLVDYCDDEEEFDQTMDIFNKDHEDEKEEEEEHAHCDLSNISIENYVQDEEEYWMDEEVLVDDGDENTEEKDAEHQELNNGECCRRCWLRVGISETRPPVVHGISGGHEASASEPAPVSSLLDALLDSDDEQDDDGQLDDEVEDVPVQQQKQLQDEKDDAAAVAVHPQELEDEDVEDKNEDDVVDEGAENEDVDVHHNDQLLDDVNDAVNDEPAVPTAVQPVQGEERRDGEGDVSNDEFDGAKEAEDDMEDVGQGDPQLHEDEVETEGVQVALCMVEGCSRFPNTELVPCGCMDFCRECLPLYIVWEFINCLKIVK